MKFLLNALFAFYVGVSLNAAGVNPVLHASFDQDFRAEGSDGVVEGKHAMKLTMETLSMLLQNGVKGKAAKIGVQAVNNTVDASFIHYPGKYINAKEGTITFWLSPLNWDFKDAKFHVFCEAHGPNEWLVVYKYGDGHTLYFLYGQKGNTRGVNWVIADAAVGQWERGTFRHVAISWDQQKLRVYLDGILKCTEKLPKSALPDHFTMLSVGPKSAGAWKNQLGESLIDDFRVYDRQLTGAQVEELYTSYGFKELDKSQIPVRIPQVKMMTDPAGKALNLTFAMTRTTMKRAGFPVEMEVVLNGKETVLKKVLQSPFTEYHYTFELADIAKGDYQLFLRPVRETAQDKIENTSFIFTIGDPSPVVDHSVPAPWIPVRLKNAGSCNELTAKMQKTRFDKSIFPVQLTSENTGLLRGPMQFICNGQPFDSFSSFMTVKKHPDLYVVETSGTNGQFELKSRCRFEFDGMMWFEVTLTPKGRQMLSNAKIIIPLRPEVSTLYNRFAKDYYNFRSFQAGALENSVKCNHYVLNDLPVLWMGNEERGLYYFTQDQVGRRLKNRAETIRLDPGEAGATLTVNLIDYDSVQDGPVTWRFGLQVTPMRPFIRNRTLWRPGKNVGLWFPWEKVHNVPDVRFKYDNYAQIRRDWSNNGKIPLFHYFAGFSASPENPGYPQHAYEWSTTPPAVGTEVSPNTREWRYVFICANSESYRNTYFRDMEKTIRELKMQYLYFDNCWSRFCSNEKHGCGWRDEHGRLYPSANILGSRELAKGNYRIHRREYPFGLIARHISQIPEPPLVSFADCLVDGECFMMEVGRDENYYKVFKPDFFRTSFIGVPFGIPSVYIAQFNRAYNEHFPEKLELAKAGKLKNQEKNLHHFMGYAVVHDADVWPNFGIDAKSVWDVMDKAGVGDDTPFYGYWVKRNPVKKVSPATDRVMVSSYAANDGMLTVIMNDTDSAVKTVLALDKKTFAAVPKLADAESGEKLTADGITVPARDYRLIRIQK